MAKYTKKWLIVAGCLILTGCMFLGGVMTMLKWDFSKLSTFQYETNAYTIGESFQDISLSTDTAHITFVPSQNGECSVVCYEQENATHFVGVENGALVIRLTDTRKWYEHIGINFTSPKITVTLPQEEYGMLSVIASTGSLTIPENFGFKSMDISVRTGNVTNYASASGTMKITASTGNIQLKNISAETVDLSVSTGDIKMHDVKCVKVISKGTTGTLTMKNVVASDSFTLERSTGDIKMEACDASEISAKARTGDIRGSLLSPKVFFATTSTGDVTVPNTATGGKCELSTTTGDIHITIN